MTALIEKESAIVATKKARVVTYLDWEIKEKAERLAATRRRSLSNLLEVLIEDAVKEAEATGELPVEEEGGDR
jgi:hypothetical protein